MSTSRFENEKLVLNRTPDDRKPLLQRLNRVEGQIRGLKAMIEEDRYCPDELQQIKAAIAALKQVAAIIAEQHITAASGHAVKAATKDIATLDIMRVFARDAQAVGCQPGRHGDGYRRWRHMRSLMSEIGSGAPFDSRAASPANGDILACVWTSSRAAI